MTSRMEYTFVVQYYEYLIVTVVQKINGSSIAAEYNFLFSSTKDLDKASKLKFGQIAFS